MDVHVTAEDGNLERVKVLLEQGVDKDKGDSGGATPLRLASYYGHFQVVQYLVEQGASLDKATSNAGNTPLIDAAAEGNNTLPVRAGSRQGQSR